MNLAVRRGEKADQPCYFNWQIPSLKLPAIAIYQRNKFSSKFKLIESYGKAPLVQ